MGGLDLDRKWIIIGNELITGQSHLLIEAHVCRCRAVVEVYKKQTHCWMHGEQTVSIFQLDGITRNKTVYKRVASMLSRDHNWALCTNRHGFKLVVRTQSKWIDPVSYEVD